MRDDESIPRLRRPTGLEADAAALAEYARRPVPHSTEQRPYTPYETDTFSGYSEHTPVTVRSATVTPLNPPKQPSLQDEILEILDELVADIRSGKVTPLHLILSFAGDRENSVVYDWHGIGLSRFEMIGHLTAEATQLAMESDE